MNIKTQLQPWLEAFVITVLFAAAGVLLRDPFSMNSPFPWIWFAPVMIALRYGLWPSQFSILFLLAAYLLPEPARIYDIDFQLFLLGGFLLTVVCIILHSGWSKRLLESEELSKYLQARVRDVADAYKVVSLAYQRLEHSFVGKPVTIRSSLIELRQMLAKAEQPMDQALIHRFLSFLALHCNLEVAAIYSIENRHIAAEPLCSIGKIGELKPKDFLIRESFDRAAIAHVTTDEILKGHLSEYLVVAPFMDQDNQIYALLLIQEMPFLSLNEENLATLNLFLQYFTAGNLVAGAGAIMQAYPDCPNEFANELQRLSHLAQSTGQDSALAALDFQESVRQQDYLHCLTQQKRGIDTVWVHQQAGRQVLFVLMPLTGRVEMDSYRARINGILKNEFAIQLNEKEIQFSAAQLSSFSNPITLIEDLVRIK